MLLLQEVCVLVCEHCGTKSSIRKCESRYFVKILFAKEDDTKVSLNISLDALF